MLFDFVRPSRGRVSAATAAAIKTFDLEDKLALLPAEIGYGDRRLVAIARALAGEPAVLLLDEPAAGLSEQERVEVTGIITRVAREWNIAVLLIEHDVEIVRAVADRVIALDFGRQIASGSADDVLADPAVIEAYLGAPLKGPAAVHGSSPTGGSDDPPGVGARGSLPTAVATSHKPTGEKMTL